MAVTREIGEVAACSLARERRRRKSDPCTRAAPGQRENTETVAKQKQLPSASLAYIACAGRAARRSCEY